MSEMLEKFNTANVALRNVVYFLVAVIGITLAYGEWQSHMNDHALHGFDREWRNRIEEIEFRLKGDLFTENWRMDIVTNKKDLETLMRRMNVRHDRTNERIDNLLDILKEMKIIKVIE